jgi:prophage regulatory protein
MPRRLVRERERREITGIPTSTCYQLMRAGQFPFPVKIGPRAVAWVESELHEWVDARISARSA